MAKIQLEGFVVDVGTVQYVGVNNTPKQNIIFKVPGYVDRFTGKQGQDDFWNITLMGTAIDKFNIHERHISLRAKAEVYVNSREYTSRDGNIGYIVNVCLLYTSPSPRDLSTSRMPSSA